MKLLITSAASLALMSMPMTASAQLFGGFDNGTLLSGAVGAGLGGAIGSNLAGAGVRDEGTAIGAVLGGLAGAAYGNRGSRYGGNPYAGSFNPGFSGNSLLGAGIGAGLGGAIGSNLAGSGVRQEGTAIGAALGGLIGYGVANRGGNSRYGGSQYGGVGYGSPVYNGPAYGGAGYGAPIMGGGFAAPNFPAPQPFATGQYISNTYVSSVVPGQAQVIAPPPVMPAPVYTAPRVTYTPDLTIAAPTVRLAGPSLERPDIYVGVTRRETMPIMRAERIVIPAPAPRHVHTHAVTVPTTYSVGGTPGSTRYAAPNVIAPISHGAAPVMSSGHHHSGPTLCYKGSSKRYDAHGKEIISNGCGH